MKPETFMLHGHEVAVDGRNLDMRLFWTLIKSMVMSPAQVVSRCFDDTEAITVPDFYMCPAITDLVRYLGQHCTVMGLMVVDDCAMEARQQVKLDLGNHAFITSALPYDEAVERSVRAHSKAGYSGRHEWLWRQEYRHEWLDQRIAEA